MHWTRNKPTRTGWYWQRHVVGDIPSDAPRHCIIMRRTVQLRGRWVYQYDKRPSVYWNGKWIDIKDFPEGYRWFWSDKPIRMPQRGASLD